MDKYIPCLVQRKNTLYRTSIVKLFFMIFKKAANTKLGLIHHDFSFFITSNNRASKCFAVSLVLQNNIIAFTTFQVLDRTCEVLELRV